MSKRHPNDLVLPRDRLILRRCRERIGDDERRTVRDGELVAQLQHAPVALTARRDQSRPCVGQLRLRTRHIQRDPDAGGKLLPCNIEELGGER